jgi:hypothetical protein
MRFIGYRVVQVAALVCATALATTAQAATIYGSIQQSNRQPVPQRDVVLTCGNSEVARARTDDRGKYRISIGQTGTCRVSIDGATGTVVLYPERPTQYNFEIRGPALVRVN